MKWGVTYSAAEGDGGSAGGSVGVISSKHDEFKDLLNRMETEGKISVSPNEGVNLDTPVGSDGAAPSESSKPAQPVAESRSNDIDSPGVGVDADDARTARVDTSADSSGELEQSQHSDDLIRSAIALGLSQSTINRMDEETLRTTLSDIANSRLADPRLRMMQQAPQPYPQGQPSQGNFQQPDPRAVQSGQQAPQQHPVDWRAELARMKKSGDYDESTLKLLEGMGAQSEAAFYESQVLRDALARQQNSLVNLGQQRVVQDKNVLNELIENLNDSETYGKLLDFMQKPDPRSWNQEMQEKNNNALLLEARVNQLRHLGMPLNKETVSMAHQSLFGAQRTAAQKAAASKVIKQSNSRMGSSAQPARGNGGQWSGPPSQDPELMDFIASRRAANRGL